MISRRSFLGLFGGVAVVAAVGEWPALISSPLVQVHDVLSPVGRGLLHDLLVCGGDTAGLFTMSRPYSDISIVTFGVPAAGWLRWVAADGEEIVMPDGMPSVVIDAAHGQTWRAVWIDEADNRWVTHSDGRTEYCGHAPERIA